MIVERVYPVQKDGRHAQELRYWWAQAEQSLASAERELEAGAYGYAMNRLYFAAYYAVCAALLDRHVAFEREAAIRVAFIHKFIRTGAIDSDWALFYDQMAEDRQTADFTPLASFERDYVEDQLDRCRQFLHEMRSQIASLPMHSRGLEPSGSGFKAHGSA